MDQAHQEVSSNTYKTGSLHQIINRRYNETDLWIGRARLGIGNLLLLRVLTEVQNTLIHPPVSITGQKCNILYSKIFLVTITGKKCKALYIYNFSLGMYHNFSKIAKEFSIYLVNVIGLTAVSSKEAKAILVPLEDHQRGTVEPSTSSS